MKTLKLCLAALAFSLVSSANTFAAAVGYYNVFIFPGDNLVANQLDNGTNTLNSLFNNQSLPNGDTFTMWDSTANQFTPISTYDATSKTWSINYLFGFGEGGVLHDSAGYTNTFVGIVYPGFDVGTGVLDWHPNYSPGLHLIASPVPLADSTFQDVVGREPRDGEWVKTLDPMTQTYTLTTYHLGTGWDNGTPGLAVGEAAWFNLVAVPEPCGLVIGGLGAVVLACSRRRTAATLRRFPRLPGGNTI